MQPERESRPASHGPAESISAATKFADTRLAPATDSPRQTHQLVADLDAMAEAMRGYFVVQVTIDDAGHRRTTLYRSAGAAEQTVKRARGRGRDVHVTLAQLVPVGVIVGLGGDRR